MNHTVYTELQGLRTVLNTIGAYIFLKDIEGRYLYANDLVCQLFGIPLEQVIGRKDEDFFDLEISNNLRLNDRRVMDNGETISSEESNIIKPTGETRIYWTVKTPVRNAKGEIIGMSGISTDITERKRLETELREQHELLDTVLNNVDAHVYMKTDDRHFLYANNKTAELFGTTPSNIKDTLDTDLISQELADQLWKLDKAVFETGKKIVGEEKFADANGNERHYMSVKVPLKRIGKREVLIGFSSDITELNNLKEELRQQALTDVLTGVPNRRFFLEEAEKEFLKSKRYSLALTAISIDLDYFKKINDTYGHNAGDIALCTVASHIQKMIRKCDVLARVGGEEFSVLLPNTDLEEAELLANRIRTSLEEIRITGDWVGEIIPTISIGISTLHNSDNNIGVILKRADRALYQAKNSGRNRVCIAERLILN
ncbi:MAG: diguanylate cyclase [Leptospiraceae bacterium]|nr:diguanylate cyclase [Leptospiraceae bacterium]